MTGAGAIQHDLDPVFNQRPEARRADDRAPDRAPRAARRVRALVGGDDPAHLRRAARSRGTLGIVYWVASTRATPTYATNLVQLIGLGIAVDYSLLIVYRFREELAARQDVDDAVVRTMETAGRAVVFSGIAVALGLALLVAMPLPFMRMLGRRRLPDPDRLDRRAR